MSNLQDVLERLGLSQYHHAFVEGFDSWETVMDITETDLESMDVKLGHRRKLQRAILNSTLKNRLPLSGLPQSDGKNESLCDGDDNGRDKVSSHRHQPAQLRQQETSSSTTTEGGQPRSKRKYRRHPKADEFAPERPPSAYVIFSNQMRDNLKGKDLTFTEIAKLVGERWQELETHEKEPCEKEAQGLKDRYYADLREYKKTPQYQQYQDYLIEFKAKHADPKQENKKPKLQHSSSQQQTPSPSANVSTSGLLSLSGQTQETGSPSESQNSPANSHSSPGSITHRRFPLAQLLSDDAAFSSYLAWRPAPPPAQANGNGHMSHPATTDNSRAPLPTPLTTAATDHQPTNDHRESLPYAMRHTKTASSDSIANPFANKLPLLNWPMHTMLPPIDIKASDQPTSRNYMSPVSTMVPHQSSPTMDTRHTSSSSKKPTLSTLLLATEHVERGTNDSGSLSASGMK